MALALASPVGFDGDPIDHRRPATEPGEGRSPYHQKGQSNKHSQRGDGGDVDDRVVRGAEHNNDIVTSPSLDILTGDYRQDGISISVSRPAAGKTVASASSSEEEGRRGWMERGNTSGVKGDEGTREEARDTEARKAKLRRTRGSTTVKENEGKTQTGDDVVGNQGPPGRLQTSTARYTTQQTPGGGAYSCCDAVLPMNLPGEPHNTSFGAAAKAVVLVSGSSRLMVSRCNTTRPPSKLCLATGTQNIVCQPGQPLRT